ncbi:amino acid transporter ATP-binding protein [Acetobacter nitrogenifigens DSM 23921 = NBRC 105050]|uniref:Glutamine ABC transporter ATP-binding protein n=1 Tax=Acetobacter nitrogenifigens DSM 23921 = NBRC 105050 TaxID=1120919 RepID=A0A511XBT2_9PROT|nr:glutamine ABC transporter ATP-binding protein GlnQ [Acetobacter nitrogenifigens]GBQ88480.1 amino acid transporter ATP-binding protein [Acetobacter nitrogenifigens DSM 23921 = NBRC 105050]GEN60416.1 glutamine ABC transporter ATP-binding protein [Acetobacter nitrogenifigens DSM 23921 = NBRC 105050]
MIEFRQTTKRFGDHVVLRPVELSVKSGEVAVIIGPSGSGKSTMLRCVNALEKISGGDLLVNELSVLGSSADIRQIRRQAGMVFQQFNLFPNLTALQNVMFGPIRAKKYSKSEAKEIAKALLGKVGLFERKNHYPSQLSGGQQQRVAIARALAVQPRLMLFDEPTSALDPELRQEVMKVMQTLAMEGMTMMVVTHEMHFARQVGSRLIFMENGRVVHDGEPAALLSSPPSERFHNFLQHVQ